MPAIPIHRPPSAPRVKMLGYDVRLTAARSLRVGLLLRDGQPDELVMAPGTGHGATWREDPAEGLILPGLCLRELRETLEALESRQRYEASK